jgi:hypothetical protein
MSACVEASRVVEDELERDALAGSQAIHTGCHHGVRVRSQSNRLSLTPGRCRAHVDGGARTAGCEY